MPERDEAPLGFMPVDAGDPDVNRELNRILAHADTSPPMWWYMSFCDTKKPKGTQWLGAVLVKASNVITAIDRAWELGINPGGEVATVGPFQESDLPDPTNVPREVLLNREQASWSG